MALDSIQAIHDYFGQTENRATFFARVHKFTPPYHRDSLLIADAYQVSKDAFRGVRRKRGERYFEHCRAVAVILMDILEVRRASNISAGLLHDIVEDCEAEWSIECIYERFGSETGVLVGAMTMPNGEFASREQRLEIYHAQLLAVGIPVISIKLADRFHNLYTCEGLAVVNQIRMILETEQVYLPLAKEHDVLYRELTLVLDYRRRALELTAT